MTVDEQTGPLNLVEVGLDVLALDHELVEVVQAHVPVFLRQVLLLQGAARLLGQAGPCFLVYFNYQVVAEEVLFKAFEHAKQPTNLTHLR